MFGIFPLMKGLCGAGAAAGAAAGDANLAAAGDANAEAEAEAVGDFENFDSGNSKNTLLEDPLRKGPAPGDA